jgi:serine/threonine-protein kinase
MPSEGAAGKLPLAVGRYVLHHEIATGGMAKVYLGQLRGPVGFTRLVAVERMHRQLAQDRTFVTMFMDEVWLAARIQHPNVVATIDVVLEDGELFMVMDYVNGASLSALLHLQGGPVPLQVAGAIVGSALLGLHAAHEAATRASRSSSSIAMSLRRTSSWAATGSRGSSISVSPRRRAASS